MWWCSTPTLFMFHPPLCPCYKKHAAFWNMKNTPDLANSNRLRKPGCPVRRIVVNRDPFREPPLREVSGVPCTDLPALPIPPYCAKNSMSALVDCLLIALHLLLDRQPLDHLPWLRRRPKL